MKILSMSGYVPEEICDTVRFSAYKGERLISHYCGYAADFIGQAANDPDIDGAVFPHSCDSSRIIKSYLGDTDKFLFQLNIPLRQDSAAVEYFANILMEYKQSIEEHYGIVISDIPERAELLKKRNERLLSFYNALDELKYSQYLRMLHELLSLPLIEQAAHIREPENIGNGKNVFLIGSYLSNINIVETIEECGLKIVGDNLPESGRAVSRKISAEGNMFESISRSILLSRQSPTQNNFDVIVRGDLDIINARSARGVIFVTQKYCEPYDYLFYVYKKALDEKNIPVLHLTYGSSFDEKDFRLAIEAFADIL